MTIFGKAMEIFHRRVVRHRRVEVLCRHLAAVIPRGSGVLDVGCGDGAIAQALIEARPDISIQGIDVKVRERTALEILPFDGRTLPYGNGTFDVVQFVDVLHHTRDCEELMAEAVRVARVGVLIKDHLREGLLGGPTLRLMDWVGNHYEGVGLLFNYWTEEQWRRAWQSLPIRPELFRVRLGLYRPPLSWFFDRKLHFLAFLVKEQAIGSGSGIAGKGSEVIR